MRGSSFGKVTVAVVAAALGLLATPAHASTSCSTSTLAGSNSCLSFWCNTGERVTISVSGLLASGTASCGGASASCSTGLSLSCSATSSGTVVVNNSTLHCTVAGYNASANCSG